VRTLPREREVDDGGYARAVDHVQAVSVMERRIGFVPVAKGLENLRLHFPGRPVCV
jgi:hypothetical protein